MCACTHLVRDLCFMLHHLSGTVSLAKLDHQTHSHLSSHLWVWHLTSSSYTIDSVCACVCVCVCVCVCSWKFVLTVFCSWLCAPIWRNSTWKSALLLLLKSFLWTQCQMTHYWCNSITFYSVCLNGPFVFSSFFKIHSGGKKQKIKQWVSIWSIGKVCCEFLRNIARTSFPPLSTDPQGSIVHRPRPSGFHSPQTLTLRVPQTLRVPYFTDADPQGVIVQRPSGFHSPQTQILRVPQSTYSLGSIFHRSSGSTVHRPSGFHSPKIQFALIDTDLQGFMVHRHRPSEFHSSHRPSGSTVHRHRS